MSDIDVITSEMPAELAQARATRDARIRLSIISSFLTKPLAVVIPIITVPLFLKYLGNTRYGLYESIGAMVAWLALSNIGLGLGLINKLTDTHVSGDRDLARRYVSTIMVILPVIAVAGTLLMTVITPLVNWGAVFPTDDPVALREMPFAVWLCGFAVFIGMFATVPPAVYTGYQETHRNNIWDGVSKVVVLIVSVIVVHTRFGLAGVVASATLVPASVRLVNLADLLLREKRWLLPHPRLFDKRLLRVLVLEGVSLFILATAAVGIFQSDKLIIGSVLGPQEVSGFAILGRLFLIVFGVYIMVIAPLWPAHGEAFRRGDVRWIRSIIRRSSIFGSAIMLACGAVLFFFGDFVMRVWTRGQDIHLSRMLILGMTATFVTRAWIECRTVVLNGAGYLVPQMYFLGANAILNIIIGILLARRYGVEGVAWSIPISTLLTSCWGYPWLINRCIRAKIGAVAAAQVTPQVTPE